MADARYDLIIIGTAGNCTSPLAGPHYIGAGLSIGASSVFGYRAAQHMKG
jgi:hypothetical protein